jgi:hypothetical protein
MRLILNVLARIADDVYHANNSFERDLMLSRQRLAGTFVANNSHGFQGCVYQNEQDTVVAFRGTATAGGVTADVRLALRNMPNQVADARQLYEKGKELHGQREGRIVVCGHSLGGYLTQAICALTGSFGITFNAAGARSLFTGRALGLGATFSERNLAVADVRVLNVTVMGDVVSARIAGRRIGKKLKIGSLGDVAGAHFMSTVKALLVTNPLGRKDLWEALNLVKD